MSEVEHCCFPPVTRTVRKLTLLSKSRVASRPTRMRTFLDIMYLQLQKTEEKLYHFLLSNVPKSNNSKPFNLILPFQWLFLALYLTHPTYRVVEKQVNVTLHNPSCSGIRSWSAVIGDESRMTTKERQLAFRCRNAAIRHQWWGASTGRIGGGRSAVKRGSSSVGPETRCEEDVSRRSLLVRYTWRCFFVCVNPYAQHRVR